MISTFNRKVDIKNEVQNIGEYRGLSTDIKPTEIDGYEIGNGSIYTEIDTGNIYFYDYDNKEWINFSSGGGGGGADLSKYFYNSFTNKGINDIGWCHLIKKIPEPVVCNGTSMSFAFAYCDYIPKFTIANESSIIEWNQCFVGSRDTRKLDLTDIDFNANSYVFYNMFMSSYFEEVDLSSLGSLNYTSVNFDRMFMNSKIKKINLSNLLCSGSNNTTNHMFSGCTQLEELDMSSFEFSALSSYTSMFDKVPANCLIYVKDQTEKTWLETNFSNLTNIQIKQ